MSQYTEKQLQKMEKELSKIYNQCQREIQAKWDSYMEKAESKVKSLYQDYQKAIESGEGVREAKAVYERAMLNLTLNNRHYKSMVDQVTEKLTATNEIAVSYLNGKMVANYCHSYNEFANESIKGYSFELVDESTVQALIKNGDKNLLPPKKVNIPKDKAWNMKNVNSQVMQGILQGENIKDISKRLRNVTDMNYKSSIRNARTMTTGAECKGRMDSYRKASADGVIMKKVWVSNDSERTRDWHAELSGVEVDIDEPFENEYGEIMYPGDPDAEPANVYNCRCSIKTHILGFRKPDI